MKRKSSIKEEEGDLTGECPVIKALAEALAPALGLEETAAPEGEQAEALMPEGNMGSLLETAGYQTGKWVVKIQMNINQ